MASIISAKKVNVWYNGLHAIKDTDITFEEKTITALVGASGSGKSTFLRCINRMIDTVPIARVQGEILYKGNNILLPETDIIALRRNIGMVFQNPTPFPKSVYDNVAYGLEVQGAKNSRQASWLGQKEINGEKVEKSNDPVDQGVHRSLQEAALWEEVKDRLHISAFRLSGGQQQRLCIARSIAVRPDVLLLDEPCSELDPISMRKIETLLLELKKNYTIIIVTHNMHQARRISNRVCFFHLGDLIECGDTADIFSSPKEALTKQYIAGAFG